VDDDGEATAICVGKGSSELVTETPINNNGDGSRTRSREGVQLYKECCGRRSTDERASGMAVGGVATAAARGTGGKGWWGGRRTRRRRWTSRAVIGARDGGGVRTVPVAL
jgi:hypothetical protein